MFFSPTAVLSTESRLTSVYVLLLSFLRVLLPTVCVSNKAFVFEPLVSLSKSFWPWQERCVPTFSSGSMTVHFDVIILHGQSGSSPEDTSSTV